MNNNVIFVLLLISITILSVLSSYHMAAGQVIFNNASQCATDLSSNPPRSPSGVAVTIEQQKLQEICANLVGITGSRTDVSGSFTSCKTYLSSQSSLSASKIDDFCNSLNPP